MKSELDKSIINISELTKKKTNPAILQSMKPWLKLKTRNYNKCNYSTDLGFSIKKITQRLAYLCSSR